MGRLHSQRSKVVEENAWQLPLAVPSHCHKQHPFFQIEGDMYFDFDLSALAQLLRAAIKGTRSKQYSTNQVIRGAPPSSPLVVFGLLGMAF